jgi:hypothetical protein
MKKELTIKDALLIGSGLLILELVILLLIFPMWCK